MGGPGGPGGHGLGVGEVDDRGFGRIDTDPVHTAQRFEPRPDSHDVRASAREGSAHSVTRCATCPGDHDRASRQAMVRCAGAWLSACGHCGLRGVGDAVGETGYGRRAVRCGMRCAIVREPRTVIPPSIRMRASTLSVVV